MVGSISSPTWQCIPLIYHLYCLLGDYMPPIPPFMRTWKHRPFETEGLWFRTTNLPPFHPVPELSLITTIKVLKDPQDWVFVGRRWRVLGQVTIPCFSQDLAVHSRDWRGRVVVFLCSSSSDLFVSTTWPLDHFSRRFWFHHRRQKQFTYTKNKYLP